MNASIVDLVRVLHPDVAVTDDSGHPRVVCECPVCGDAVAVVTGGSPERVRCWDGCAPSAIIERWQSMARALPEEAPERVSGEPPECDIFHGYGFDRSQCIYCVARREWVREEARRRLHRSTDRLESKPWAPVDLAETVHGLVAGTLTRPAPTVGVLTLCSESEPGALFYSGRVNGVAGESGAGKSWTAQLVAAQELAAGRSVVYVDLEDDEAGVVGRLLGLGSEPGGVIERFAYVHPEAGFGETAIAGFTALLDRLSPSLVVIDSTGEALALEGANPNADEEVARWFRLLPRWAARHPSRPAVLLLDHVVKTDDSGLWPIGSQRKRAAVDGAQYMQRVMQPFDRATSGLAALVCAKDRHGNYRTGKRVADLVVAAGAQSGGGAAFALVSSSGSHGGATAGFRPTVLMERVSRWLESHPGPADRTGRQLRENVTGKDRSVIEAADQLVAESFASTSEGPRGATVYTSLKPFRDEAPVA